MILHKIQTTGGFETVVSWATDRTVEVRFKVGECLSLSLTRDEAIELQSVLVAAIDNLDNMDE